MQSSSARVGAQVMVLPAPASDCAVQSPNPHRVDAVRKRLLSDELYVDIAETFRALADSTRAKIVHALTDQSLCVGDLAQVVGVSEPAVAQHLRLLAYFADRPRASHGQDGLLLPRGCPCALLTDDGSGPPARAGASGHIEPFEVSDSCVPRAGLVLGVVPLLVVMLLAGEAALRDRLAREARLVVDADRHIYATLVDACGLPTGRIRAPGRQRRMRANRACQVRPPTASGRR